MRAQVSFCGAIEMSGYLELKCSVIKGGMKLLPVVGPSPLCVNPIFELGPLEPRYSEWLVRAPRPRRPHRLHHPDRREPTHHVRLTLRRLFPTTPNFRQVFEGISVDEQGRQHFLDATLAYKRAVLNAIKVHARTPQRGLYVPCVAAPFAACLTRLTPSARATVPKQYLANFGYTEEQVYLLLSCCPCEGRISGIVDVPNAVATLAIPLAIFDRDVRPKEGAVLEALAKGVHVAKIGRDVAHESAASEPPKPVDPRLEAAAGK